MISGNRERFAIEAEVEEYVGEWVFGHFRFWLCGIPVGNWADFADLRGCVWWLRKFAKDARDRYEPALMGLGAVEAFRRVHGCAIARAPVVEPIQRVNDAYGRFWISDLGMSSFDRFDIFLLKDADGGEWCIWREGDAGEIFDCHLASNEMEKVATEFCDRFEPELIRGAQV